MGELVLGRGVVTPVPFTGRKGRTGVAEKHVYTLFQTAVQLSIVIGGLLLYRLISKPSVVQLHI